MKNHNVVIVEGQLIRYGIVTVKKVNCVKNVVIKKRSGGKMIKFSSVFEEYWFKKVCVRFHVGNNGAAIIDGVKYVGLPVGRWGDEINPYNKHR